MLLYYAVILKKIVFLSIQNKIINFLPMILSKDIISQSKSISILGYGWLGKSLCESFLSLKYSVKVSTTNKSKLDSLKNQDFKAFLINMSPQINDDFDSSFFDCETLVCCIPPKRRDDIEDFHPSQFSSLISKINSSKIKNVLFIGSTSIYGDSYSYINEDTPKIPSKPSGRALLSVENILKSELQTNLTILRFGGLIGYDRIPGRFLAGKKNIANGLAPVNLIHRDDCVNIISAIVEKNIWNKEYNACCPQHPTRAEFYTQAAIVGAYEVPEFIMNKKDFKQIDPNNICEDLKYKFIFENPLNCLA